MDKDDIKRELEYFASKAEREYYEDLIDELLEKYKNKISQNAPQHEIQEIVDELRSSCGFYINNDDE